MATQRISYCSDTCIGCGSYSSVILNIPAILCDTPPCGETGFIPGTLISQTKYAEGCGVNTYQYVIEYDDALIEPGQTLKPENILGVICENVFTRWVESLICELSGGSSGGNMTCVPEGLCPVFALMGLCGFYDAVGASMEGSLQTIWIKQRESDGTLRDLFDVFPTGLNPLFFTPHITITLGEATLWDVDLSGGTDEFTFAFPANGTYRITGSWVLKIGSTTYTYTIPCVGNNYIEVTITGVEEGPN